MSANLDWVNAFAPPPPPKPNPNGPEWEEAFDPKVSAPSDPQTVATIVPKVSKGNRMQTYQAILQYNNDLPQFANGVTVYTISSEGVTIHKITEEQAMAVSTRTKVAAADEKIPLTVALACQAIESTFDPLCVNENIGSTSAGIPRSNPNNDPGDYDLGIDQLKSKYLVGLAAGVTDDVSAAEFSDDVNKAISYFCGLMASKVLWAQNVIQANAALQLSTAATLQHAQVALSELQTQYGATPTADQKAEIAAAAATTQAAQDAYDAACKPDHRLSNPYLLATGAYNFGDTGMTTYYEEGQFPSHCQHVIDLEQYFAKLLGVVSVFAGM